MPDYKYLIIGGGMTADAAVEGIREVDPSGSIGLVSAETDRPYSRPPLSKGLWKGKALDSIWRGTESKQVDLHLGRTVTHLDTHKKQVTDDSGTSYTYDKLLLATGGAPRRLPFGGDDIIYYRTVQDYHRLRALAEHKQHFVVIGSGFIGTEVAAALATNGKQVTMVYLEQLIGERIFPTELARFVTDYYQQKDVEQVPADSVAGLEKRGDQFALTTKNGKEIVADGVVAGLGIVPNTQIAEAAGLEVDNGIVVNKHLQTSASDVYAAGDVAAFVNAALHKRVRVEHEDNALTMGKMAGQNMAGQAVKYDHLPFFYSDMFDLGYEAVGELDSRLETVADWQTPNEKGVIYYLSDGRVRGVLLWNVWDKVEAARQLVKEAGPFTSDNLKGRIG